MTTAGFSERPACRFSEFARSIQRYRTRRSSRSELRTLLQTLAVLRPRRGYRRLHLVPITTPKASPESNGMAEAFVNTLKRDYASGADRCDAATVLDAIAAWIAGYNAIAPHSSLGYRSPLQHRPRYSCKHERTNPKMSHELRLTARIS